MISSCCMKNEVHSDHDADLCNLFCSPAIRTLGHSDNSAQMIKVSSYWRHMPAFLTVQGDCSPPADAPHCGKAPSKLTALLHGSGPMGRAAPPRPHTLHPPAILLTALSSALHPAQASGDLYDFGFLRLISDPKPLRNSTLNLSRCCPLIIIVSVAC